MEFRSEGRAHRLGDDVNTDHIISSSRKKETLDPHRLKEFLFEVARPGFATAVKEGDVVVAGANFGCGSAMEVAVTTLLASGIHVILARSFARTFYRNALNNGLIPLECDTSDTRDGDRIEVGVSGGDVRVNNLTTGTPILTKELPPTAQELLDVGGIVPLIRNRGALRSS
jgi:3-isopropylmalate/(R)-2-methylmalate dehydratase small subunit